MSDRKRKAGGSGIGQEKKTKTEVLKKIFNDPIHGTMEVHPLCVKIIDTPQFQRLRQIKQLGGCYYVYPGACHKRFEHSIGVSHLAGNLARTLKEKQPELGITEEDILCVEIAGLCHDLGHGPFSHLFDRKFIPRIKKMEGNHSGKWEHEDASLMMFDHLIKENNLDKEFVKYGLQVDGDDKDNDKTFIKELFYGPLNKTEYSRRERGKRFLYDIVANKRNGIDVDKWDYFGRDCYMLGFSNSFDHTRLVKLARVLTVDESPQIGFRDKEVEHLYDLFYTRHTLHRRACQHKVNLTIEAMIVEALVLANEHLKLEYKDGETTVEKKMSEAIYDMKAYEQLTDNVLYDILKSLDTNMEEARDMVKNVFERKLYKCIGTYSVPKSNEEVVKKSDDEIKEEIVASAQSDQLETLDLIVEHVKYDYGKKKENPIESVYFYSKEDNTKPFTIPKHKVSSMLLDHFHEMEIRVYCKDEKKKDIAKKGFEECLKKWPQHKPCQTCKSTY